jgi:ankyrin repeat protein
MRFHKSNDIAAGETLCHVAVKKNHIGLLSSLIKNRANVNAVDQSNQTPLNIACALEACDLAKLLVDAGADVHTTTNQGRELFLQPR